MRTAILGLAAALVAVFPAYGESENEPCGPGETLVFYNAAAQTSIKERLSPRPELLVYYQGKEYTYPTGGKGSGISARIVLFPNDDLRAMHFATTVDGHSFILLGNEAYWEACMNEETLEVTGYTSWEVEASAL